jgi:hypothetical protein
VGPVKPLMKEFRVWTDTSAGLRTARFLGFQSLQLADVSKIIHEQTALHSAGFKISLRSQEQSIATEVT